MGKEIDSRTAGRVALLLSKVVTEIPTSAEPKAERPAQRAAELAFSAKVKAAAVSGTLALPPGPTGLLTIVPDLLVIWKIQQQLVVDIAAAYGREANLAPEEMLYCLFRHAGGLIVRDLVVRVGERMVLRRASLRVMQQILEKIGYQVTQRVIRAAVGKWIPFIGATGIAAYAWWDTGRVAKTASEYFGPGGGGADGVTIPAPPDDPAPRDGQKAAEPAGTAA